jgi:hypothetical protein
MRIEIAGMEEKPVDFKLKLIKSSGCFLLVAIDKTGEEHSIFKINDDGSTVQCREHLKYLL